MKRSQEEMAQSVVKKVKRSKRVQKERKRKEIGVREHTALLAPGWDFGRQMLIKKNLRQKIIRLADRSDFGWDLISEYEVDELAVNSRDEKRITKAEKAANPSSAEKGYQTA